MSLRHVPLRGTGWSRNPTSSGVAQQGRDQRVRRRTAKFRKHAFLASRKNFELAEHGSTLLGVRSATQRVNERLPPGEKPWVTKKTSTLRCKPRVTSTTRSRSKFSAVWKRCGCVPPCTSARPEEWALTNLGWGRVGN